MLCQKDGQVFFRPNSDHPVFRAYADQLPDDLKDGFYRCIRIVGSGLPIETLHAELVGNAESVITDHADEEDLRQLVITMANALLDSGIPADAISGAMQILPVLRDNWNVAQELIKEYLSQSGLGA